MRSLKTTKKIKIIEFLATKQIGGAENVVRNICRNANRQKFEIKVVTSYASINHTWPTDLEYFCLNKKSKGFKPQLILEIKKILLREKPDVIHSHSLFSLPYIIMANLFATKSPIIQTIHNDLDYYNPRIWKSIFHFFKIHTVSLSPSLNQSLQKSKFNSNIANGIELNVYNRPANIRSNVLFVGRLTEQKDPIYFIRIVQQINNLDPSYKFILIGQGQLKGKIQRIISKEKITNLRLIGRLVDLRKYYESCDLMFSTSKWEGLPLTVIEAMSRGIVLFAKPAGAIGDLIENGRTGFMLDKNLPPDKAAEFFLAKTADKVRIKKISHAASKKAKQFSVKKMVDQYEDLFRKLANK